MIEVDQFVAFAALGRDIPGLSVSAVSWSDHRNVLIAVSKREKNGHPRALTARYWG